MLAAHHADRLGAFQCDVVEQMGGAKYQRAPGFRRYLRAEVLRRIRGTDCCTHLNDALRSLAEVPVLAATLPG